MRRELHAMQGIDHGTLVSVRLKGVLFNFNLKL
jgi:hypothetical protein